MAGCAVGSADHAPDQPSGSAPGEGADAPAPAPFPDRGEGRLVGAHGDAELHADLLAGDIAGKLVISGPCGMDARFGRFFSLSPSPPARRCAGLSAMLVFAGIDIAGIFGGQEQLVGRRQVALTKGAISPLEPGIDVGLAAFLVVGLGPVAEGLPMPPDCASRPQPRPALTRRRGVMVWWRRYSAPL